MITPDDHFDGVMTAHPGSARRFPQTAEPDMADQLQELSKLKDLGILTEEEFQAKKKQILDF